MKTRSQTARSAPLPRPDWTRGGGSLQPAPGTIAPKVSRASCFTCQHFRFCLHGTATRHSSRSSALFLFLLSVKRWRPSLLTHVNHSISFTCHVESCKSLTANELSVVKRGQTSPSTISGRKFFVLGVFNFVFYNRSSSIFSLIQFTQCEALPHSVHPVTRSFFSLHLALYPFIFSVRPRY